MPHWEIGDQGVAVQPLQRFRRQEARDGRVEARRAGVDVREGPLPAPADVLFFRRVAHLQNHVQALGLVPDGVPGGTEVQQLHHAVLGDVDVVRRHVPVDEALRVNGGQRPQDRDHHIQGLFNRDLPAVVGDVRLEGDALDVVHDEVGRVVLVKIAGDGGDVGVADELGQGPGLLLEPLRPVGELLGLGVHGHRHRRSDAGGDVVGHELLDGHLGVQLGVQGQVGDAKSALAEDPSHDVAAVQHGPGPQGHGEFPLVLLQVEPAVRAGARALRPLLKAVVAEIFPLRHAPHAPSVAYWLHHSPLPGRTQLCCLHSIRPKSFRPGLPSVETTAESLCLQFHAGMV